MVERVIDRLAALDPAVLHGLLAEHVARQLADVDGTSWPAEFARERGIADALRAAEAGARPARPLTEPPTWLAAAVRDQLHRAATSWRGAFLDVRVLEHLGLVAPPHDADYVLACVSGLTGDRRWGASTMADMVRADPVLRDDVVWRLFEVEGGGEVSLASIDKYSHEPDTPWAATVLELVADGTLPRDRVLDAALGALARDFSSFRAGWFSRLLRALEPTPAELAARQEALRGLLRSDVAATVAAALAALVDVEKAGLLDGPATVPALRPCLEHPVRATAETALRLATSLARRDPALVAALAPQVAAALAHPHTVVQERAARLLRGWGAEDVLAASADALAPGVARGLGLAAPDAGLADVAAGVASQAPLPGPAPVSGPAPVPADPAPAPDLTPATGAELVEILAALLEDAGDPVAIERALAGLAAGGPTEALAPLVKRATRLLDRGPAGDVLPGWLRGQLARVVLHAAGRPLPPLAWPRPTESGGPLLAARFLARRIDEVVDVLAGAARPGPLLATPDHAAGWIAPETLVTRVLAGGTARPYDLAAALLRLGPPGRADALARLDARSSAGPATDLAALRHALGAPPPVPRRRLLTRRPGAVERSWWCAAARARDPLASDPWVASLGLEGAGRADPLDLTLGVPEPWVGALLPRNPRLPWIDVTRPAAAATDAEPTAATDAAAGFPFGDLREYVDWAATLYPADAEHLSWVTGLAVVGRSLPRAGVAYDAPRVLDGLRRHEGRIGALTCAVLAAGLSGAGADERARAVDAVLALAARGSLTAADLGAGLVAAGPLTPLPRLAGSLRDLAATGPAGRDLAVGTLAAALPQVPTATRGLHALLEVLVDELVRSGARTTADLAPWLAGLQGSSRAARLAATLRELLPA